MSTRTVPLTPRLRRSLLGRRRLIAAALAALAVVAALRAVAPPPAATVAVVVADRDLAAGTVVGAGDLAEVRAPEALVPSGVLPAEEVVGRTLTGPVRAGEPVTDVRVVRDSLLAGYPGRVAVPVRVGDAEAAALLRAGDRIDLLAARPEGDAAAVLARDVPVLAVPRPDPEAPFSEQGTAGGLVIVAISDETAARVAHAGVSSFISVVIRR